LSHSAPSDELEVKAKVDHPDGVRQQLERAGARLEFRGVMLDRRFDRDGEFGARDEVLRLRIFRPADGAAAFGMLGWKGPQSQRGDYRHRSEVETRLTDPDAALAILQRAGFAVTLRIDRTVEVYRLGEAMLRLEWYPAMDVLLEVEGAPAAIEQAIRATGLPRDRFLPQSLPHFVQMYETRTGRSARLAERRS